MGKYQWIKLAAGPAAFVFAILLLQESFGFKGAAAVATVLWMALWWILRPVSIAVTSLLPIVINALFGLIPNAQVISQYFSEICILLLGSDLICMTWSATGLDKRISVKTLCFIGTSVKQQILVWTGASVFLSVFLPNVIVAEIFCPIAVAMLKFTGETDIAKSSLAAPILLSIAWGSGIGGFGSPIGSSANLVAISYLEKITGHEFMYVDWILRFVPVLLLIFLLNLLFLWSLPLPVKELHGTKGYFKQMYESFGPMRKGEKIGLILFLMATGMAFLRPLFAAQLPSLKPAYCFLLFGLLMFVLHDENGNVMLRWEYAESHAMWGMYFLFASGIALGRLIIQTGAVDRLTKQLSALSLDGGFFTVLLFAVLTTLMAEISSNAAAASIAIPIVANICNGLSLNPVPYILVTVIAQSCAYVLPVSTRAIPVAFGLDTGVLIRQGIRLTLLNVLLTVCVGYACLQLPWFGHV